MKKIVLVGAGGHCKVIIDIIKSKTEYEIVGITDKSHNDTSLFDIPIIGDDDKLEEIYKCNVKYAFICVGGLENLEVRNKIYNNLKKIGFKLPALIHDTAIVSKHASIAEGTCIMPGGIINSGSNIGANSIINTGAIIEHDCIIGDNTHISPGAILSGGVTIGSNTHIGVGSTIIQGISIGNNVTIGAGAVVTKNIENNVLAFGVPCKIIKCK